MKVESSRQILEKDSKFHENPSCGSRVVPCGRTGLTGMTKQILAHRSFANSPNNRQGTTRGGGFVVEKAAPLRTVKILQWAQTGVCIDGCSPRIPKIFDPPKRRYLFTSPHGVTSQKTNSHEQRRENPKRFLSMDRGTVGAALSLSFNLYSDPS